MSLGYGDLARIGHLYPSGGLADYEIQLMAPDGVQFVTTRLPFRRTGLDDDLRLFDALEQHVQLVADAGVELVAVNCTAATMLVGTATIEQRVRAATGLPSVTTIDAVLAALRAVGAARPALFTPYPAEVVRAEVHHLAAEGFEVACERGRPCTTPAEQAAIEPSAWLDEVGAALPELRASGADAVLLSCAGARVAPVIDRIELVTGLPVVASNQALLWHCLRTLRIAERPAGYGALLDGRAG